MNLWHRSLLAALCLLCPALTWAEGPSESARHATTRLSGGYLSGQWRLSERPERLRAEGLVFGARHLWGDADAQWQLTLAGRRLTLTPQEDGARETWWATSAHGGWRGRWIAFELGVQWFEGADEASNILPSGRLRLGPESAWLEVSSGDWAAPVPVPGQHRVGASAAVGPGRLWVGGTLDGPDPVAAVLAGTIPLGERLQFGVSASMAPRDADDFTLIMAQLSGGLDW
ncbi:MAG: hypothetical protein ACE366_24185 [Bradymonadia bacterium]